MFGLFDSGHFTQVYCNSLDSCAYSALSNFISICTGTIFMSWFLSYNVFQVVDLAERKPGAVPSALLLL